MAGVKGRSGGARPGAGRKPKSPKTAAASTEKRVEQAEKALEKSNEEQRVDREPLDFLLWVQNDPAVDKKLRVRAAIAAAQYKHNKLHDGGKKEGVADKAKKAAQGRFAPKAPPKLVVNNR